MNAPDDTRLVRIFELASEVSRLICVEDVMFVDDPAAHRALDLAANELGHLLRLDEPEFDEIWRLTDSVASPRETA